MRIHFTIDLDELPQYTELVKQLKSLGHKVTCGPHCAGEVDAIIACGSVTPIPAISMQKLTDSVKKAETVLKRRVG